MLIIQNLLLPSNIGELDKDWYRFRIIQIVDHVGLPPPYGRFSVTIR